MRHLAVLLFVTLCATPAARAGEPFKGKVVGVADGDTITVLRGKEQVRIRLNAVDTPEKRQAFGKKAKKFTADMVAGKVVEVRPTTQDRYGRTVARVLVGDSSLNEALVKAGYAWWYRKYAPKAKKLQRCLAANPVALAIDGMRKAGFEMKNPTTSTSARTGAYEEIENIPAFMRFEKNTQKFLDKESQKLK